MTTAMPLRLHGVTKAYRGRTVLGPIDLALEAGRVYGLIGENGAVIISTLAQRLGRPLRIETHCNAGALATAAWGTATSIIYHAFENGDVEKVWVDETRPVEQGARLTAWELEQAGVPYTLISDSMAGSIMGQGSPRSSASSRAPLAPARARSSCSARAADAGSPPPGGAWATCPTRARPTRGSPRGRMDLQRLLKQF